MKDHPRLAFAGIGFMVVVGALSCTTAMDEGLAFEAVAVESATTSEGSDVADASRFDAALLAAARDYLAWPRWTHAPGWKPELCSVERLPVVLDTFLSHSEDADTHGGKLYHLYPSSFQEYWAVSRRAEDPDTQRERLRENAGVFYWPGTYRVPPGFVIVKETWSSAYADAEMVARAHAMLDEFLPTAERGGRQFVTDEREELFMMLKTDPATPGTDQGWVYGVVSTDGQTVLASGLIDSCIGCHRKAPVDRLFGMPGRLMPGTAMGEAGEWSSDGRDAQPTRSFPFRPSPLLPDP